MVAEPRRPFLIASAAVCSIALTGLLGLPAEIVGAAVCLISLLAVAQDAKSTDAGGGRINWWNLILIGLIVWVAGIPLELLLEPIGGLLETAGAALCLVGALLGLP